MISPVFYGRDRVMVIDNPTTYRGGRATQRIRATFGRTNGTFGPTRTIDAIDPRLGSRAAAANPNGDVVVAYLQRVRRGDRRAVTVAQRAPGHRFGTPRIVVGRGRANTVAVAVGARGDVLVAWEREGRVEARYGPSVARLGPIRRVGTGARLGTRLTVALSSGRRAWVAWTSQATTEGGDNGPFQLSLAVSSPGARSFRVERLDAYDHRASDEARFDLGLDRDGNGLLAWTGWDGQHFRARLAYVSASGRLLESTTLSAPGYDAVVSDLAVGGAPGEALVVWARLDAAGELGDRVLAGYRPPDGGYAGEEPVSAGDRARRPAAAFDIPGGDTPTVVWSQREGPDGPGVPAAQVRTYLRASTRTP